MSIIVLHIMLSFIAVLFFLVVPYFVSLSTVMSVIVIFLITFCSFGLGYWLAELTSGWKSKIRKRHEDRFNWYRKMGLQESACLVEPEQAEAYWKWSWEW